MTIPLESPVTEVMKRPVRRLQLNASVRDAAQFMLEAGISGAPVINATAEPVGVFSLSDIARHVQARLLDLPVVDVRHERIKAGGEGVPVGRGFHVEGLEETTVSDLMTPGVVSVPPRATVGEVVALLASTGLHRVFVMSDPLTLDGVVTSMDVLKWIQAQR